MSTKSMKESRKSAKPSFGLCILLTSQLLLLLPQSSFAFSAPAISTTTTTTLRQKSPFQLNAGAASQGDEITRQLERAREVLAKSKAKIEAREEEEAEAAGKTVPFFASKDDDAGTSVNKKAKVIKDTNGEGLFTTDGDMMAKLSEGEQWEKRPILEVFEAEPQKSTVRSKAVDRDLNASIYNLRKRLQTDDFMKIFDKRNRFIGDP